MAQKMTPSEALVASLKELPQKYRPPKPMFQRLLSFAADLKTAQDALVINTLLGMSLDYGAELPTGPVRFPRDHGLHLKAGSEWYWVSCNLEVEGSGGQDRIGVITSMTRSRAISNDMQKKAGWSAEEAQLVDSMATISVATREDGFIARRSPNVQCAALAGETRFDADPFYFQAGPDSLRGTGEDVLPLKIRIDDGPDFQIDLTLKSVGSPKHAFFLQGERGRTPPPREGIYYSWPQLKASGSVTANGTKYKVSGTAWIDHQLMMQTMVPTPNAPRGWMPVERFNGWSWCQFNLDNGDAFTVAAFQQGSLLAEAPVLYGFYLTRNRDRPDDVRWDTINVTGTLAADRFIPVTGGVLHPTAWIYEVTGAGVDIVLVPTPWYPDGSYMTGNLGIQGETPVTVALIERSRTAAPTGPGAVLTGTGYCESVGYEPPDRYVGRALAFLTGDEGD